MWSFDCGQNAICSRALLVLSKDFHLEESNSETNVVCIDERGKKYIFDEDMDGFDQDEVIGFVKKFNSGRLLDQLVSSQV